MISVAFEDAGAAQAKLAYQHRKYVMAVEGKLRTLFAALENLGTAAQVRFRPFAGIVLDKTPEETAVQVGGATKTTRIEIGVNQVGEETIVVAKRPLDLS